MCRTLHFWVMIFVFCSSIAFSENKAIVQGKIGATTLQLWDSSRERPITVELWYPVTKDYETKPSFVGDYWIYPKECRDVVFPGELGKRPLVLFSHGLGGDRRDRAWFAEKLVYEGYIVASVEHHAASWGNIDPAAAVKVWDRPLDVSFALDFLLQDLSWMQHIDSKNIGFSGYSLGGISAILLAGASLDKGHLLETIAAMDSFSTMERHFLLSLIEVIDFPEKSRSFCDERIKAFFLMAPCIGGVDIKSLQSIPVDVHVVAVENDDVLQTEHHGALLAKEVPSCSFSLLKGGAGHYVFINRVNPSGKEKIPDRLYKDLEGVNREEIHELVSEMGVCFFKNAFSVE